MPKKYATSFDFDSEIVWIKDAEGYSSSTAALNAKVPPEGVPAAKGDGTVDDTNAIQGLIDYAKTSLINTIFLPPGSYSVQALTLATGVSIVGIDPFNTKLVLRGGATNPLFSGSIQNVTISGITLDANFGAQTGNVSTVVITSGNDVTIRNMIIGGGYVNLSYIGTGGSLIIDDVMFPDAVYNHLLISGNTDVRADNLIFGDLSQLSANCCMDISTDYGVYGFTSNATTPVCIRCTGTGNRFEGFIHNAVDNLVDTGSDNDYIIYGQSQTETISGDRKITAANITEQISGDKTVNAGDISETAANKTTHITQDMTEEIDGDKHVTAGKISEMATNKTTHITQDMTEQISGTKNVTADTISETASSKTETITENKTETIGGNYIGKFGSASFETKSSTWKVKFPDKTIDLADISKISDRNFWIIGDSYGNTYDPETKTYTDGWCNLLASNLLPSLPFVNNVHVDFQGGLGFSGGSSTFTAAITNWITKYNDITDVVICAGRNDFFQSTADILTGMSNVANVIKTKFPNVRLYVGMIGYDLNITEVTGNKFYAAIETTINYKNGAASYGYTYLTNVEAILHNVDLMRTDGKHPNAEGGHKLAEGIFQSLQGCCNVGYPLRTCNITVTNGTLQSGDFREILNNTTISILNSSGINMVFSPNRNIVCNPMSSTELLGTVDFKYFNGYEYGLSRIPALFVYSNAGVYGTASGYVSFEGNKLYVSFLKLNNENNNYDTIQIDSLQIVPFSTQYTF